MDSWTLYLPKDIDIYEEVNSPNETGNNRTLVFTTGDKEKIPQKISSNAYKKIGNP